MAISRHAETQLTTGYYFPDWFSVVMPEATTNLVLNPSVETNLTGYTAVGGAIARSLLDQRRGAYGLQITPAGVSDGVSYAFAAVANLTYTFSVDIHGTAGLTYRIFFSDAAVPVGAPFVFVSNGQWQRVHVSYTEAAAPLVDNVRIIQDAGDVRPYYVDGLQIENKAYDTLYTDGDLEGFVVGEVAYGWNGIVHGSTSYRAATTRSGGRVIKLKDYGLWVVGFTGLGLSPVNNYSMPSNLGGSFYQSTVEGDKQFTLIGDISEATIGQLTIMRDLLETAFTYNLTPYRQPMLLHFQETDDCGNAIGESTFIKCVYQTGLEGVTDNLNGEKLAIQFIIYDTHGILADGDNAILTDFKESYKIGRAIMQNADGTWNILAGGTTGGTGRIYAAITASDGSTYFGGDFTNIGGVAAANIVRYNNGVFTALGAGVDALIRCLTEGPDGRIYVGGDFHNAGGAAAWHIAVWDPVGAAWAVVGGGAGGGLDDIVTGMTFVGSGDLIIVGVFLNSTSGIAANRIIRWNTTTAIYAAIATGLNNGGIEIKRLLGGNIVYVGGTFTTANAVTVNGICKLDTTTNIYSAMGIGVAGPGTVRSVLIDKTNLVHIRGDFATVNGIAAEGYAVWNGSQWVVPISVFQGADNPNDSLAPDRETIITQNASNLHFRIKNSILQFFGIWSASVFNSIISLSNGSLLLSSNFGGVSETTGVVAIAKTDLSNIGYAHKYKVVMTCLANKARVWLFRCHLLNQDATIYTFINSGEVWQIETNPLRAESTFLGDITGSFFNGSNINLPEYGKRDISIFAVEDIVIVNDGAGQVNWLNLFEGVTLANTDNGRVYISIDEAPAGSFHCDLYNDAARGAGDLVGHTAVEIPVAGGMTQLITPDNASGLGGYISFQDLSGDDVDIYADIGILEVYFQYKRFFPSLFSARYA